MIAVAQRDEEGQGGDEGGDARQAEERFAFLGKEEVGDQDDQGDRRDDDGGAMASQSTDWTRLVVLSAAVITTCLLRGASARPGR